MPLNFIDVLAAPAPDADNRPPEGLNGYISTIDVTHPVDRIKDEYKIAVSAAGHFDLRHSIALAIHEASGNNAAAPTANGLETAMPRIGRNIVQHLMLAAFGAARIPIILRPSDVVLPAAFLAKVGEGSDLFVDAADKVYNAIVNDPEVLAAVTSKSKYILLALVANAIHRKKHEGHNWLSDKTNVARTETNRATYVAGASRLEFSAFMSTSGHDVWHLLSDTTLYAAADALTGYSPTVINGNFKVNDVVHVDANMHEVFDLGDACKDRWPLGQLGVSAIAKGCDCLLAMITDITSKVSIPNTGPLFEAISLVKTDATTNERTRVDFLTLKNSMGPLMAMAYGYVMEAPGLADAAGASDALSSFAKSLVPEEMRGRTIATRMREVKADKGAVAEMLRAAFATMADVMASTKVKGANRYVAPTEVITADLKDAEKEDKIKDISRRSAAVDLIVKLGSVEDRAEILTELDDM